VRQLVLKNVDSGTIKKKAMEKGMLSLLDDGALKVARERRPSPKCSRSPRRTSNRHARLRIQRPRRRGQDGHRLKEAESPKSLRAVLRKDGVFLTDVVGQAEGG
jgi:hypothetical protein